MSEPVELHVPELCLVVLVGASGSGKSTFARRCFRETEVLSSDRFRALVSDDENDLSATDDAFAALHDVAGRRLRRGRLTVVDATNVHADSRRSLLALAREHHVLAVAIVLDMPEKLCRDRNETRDDRRMGPHVVRNHVRDLRRSLSRLKDEGFRIVHVLRTPEDVDAAVVVRDRMWTDRRDETGPFDVIGDVHGCFDELCDLLRELGWELGAATDVDGRPVTTARHPAGRKAVFLGDLVDRGPRIPDVLRLVMRMRAEGAALCVPGNHEQKLLRWLRGRNVGLTHGLPQTIEQLAAEPPELRERVAAFIDGLVSHLVLDEGRLVVAHAGLPEGMQGRASGAVRAFAMYGDTTGETDEQGLPVRYPWAVDYRGSATVVYGHVATSEAEWLNRTICIDTGCVFGGRLTALRWPERELVSVPARAEHYAPARPLGQPASRAAQHEADDLLDLADVTGRMHVRTTLGRTVTIAHYNAAAALEAMSRFAADPRWLVHLPPTMSPPASSAREDALEHPDEAFAYFREQGVTELTCEEKHMGSRALLILGRDAGATRERFGVTTGEQGVVLTRTGRRFFGDQSVEAAVIARASEAARACGLWDTLETRWLCLDAEVMPWSTKALELLRSQYAATGAAATAETGHAVAELERAAARGLPVDELLQRARDRAASAARFVDAYRRYCWRVESVDDLRIAVFHVLASEGRVHFDRPHDWHLAAGRALAGADGLFVETLARHVSLGDAASVSAATSWWEELTGAGGEGMVVKPRAFLARSLRGLVQPGVKCRGREYLRLIYGPDYLATANLERLRARGLSSKRALALRELALGHEALLRFVAREPLRRVHECVFAVLALESEPVDPRL